MTFADSKMIIGRNYASIQTSLPAEGHVLSFSPDERFLFLVDAFGAVSAVHLTGSIEEIAQLSATILTPHANALRRVPTYLALDSTNQRALFFG